MTSLLVPPRLGLPRAVTKYYLANDSEGVFTREIEVILNDVFMSYMVSNYE